MDHKIFKNGFKEYHIKLNGVDEVKIGSIVDLQKFSDQLNQLVDKEYREYTLIKNMCNTKAIDFLDERDGMFAQQVDRILFEDHLPKDFNSSTYSFFLLDLYKKYNPDTKLVAIELTDAFCLITDGNDILDMHNFCKWFDDTFLTPFRIKYNQLIEI